MRSISKAEILSWVGEQLKDMPIGEKYSYGDMRWVQAVNFYIEKNNLKDTWYYDEYTAREYIEQRIHIEEYKNSPKGRDAAIEDFLKSKGYNVDTWLNDSTSIVYIYDDFIDSEGRIRSRKIFYLRSYKDDVYLSEPIYNITRLGCYHYIFTFENNVGLMYEPNPSCISKWDTYTKIDDTKFLLNKSGKTATILLENREIVSLEIIKDGIKDYIPIENDNIFFNALMGI